MVRASRLGVANALAPSYVSPSDTSRSVTSLRRSSAARACMRAGISSDKNSSSRSGILDGIRCSRACLARWPAAVTRAHGFYQPPPPPPPPPPPDPPPPPEKPDEPDETGTALASALLTPAIDDETELLKLLLDQLPELQPER